MHKPDASARRQRQTPLFDDGRLVLASGRGWAEVEADDPDNDPGDRYESDGSRVGMTAQQKAAENRLEAAEHDVRAEAEQDPDQRWIAEQEARTARRRASGYELRSRRSRSCGFSAQARRPRERRPGSRRRTRRSSTASSGRGDPDSGEPEPASFERATA